MLKTFRVSILAALVVGIIGLSIPAKAVGLCSDDEECRHHQHCEINWPSNSGHCIATHGGRRSSSVSKGHFCESPFDCSLGQDCSIKPGHTSGHCVAIPTR
jgi:hypothetical protein